MLARVGVCVRVACVRVLRARVGVYMCVCACECVRVRAYVCVCVLRVCVCVGGGGEGKGRGGGMEGTERVVCKRSTDRLSLLLLGFGTHSERCPHPVEEMG